jgi:hypothetical protein
MTKHRLINLTWPMITTHNRIIKIMKKIQKTRPLSGLASILGAYLVFSANIYLYFHQTSQQTSQQIYISFTQHLSKSTQQIYKHVQQQLTLSPSKPLTHTTDYPTIYTPKYQTSHITFQFIPQTGKLVAQYLISLQMLLPILLPNIQANLSLNI